MLRRDAEIAHSPLGTGLPFIFQVVLLLLLPLAVVYSISVVALAVDLLLAASRHSRAKKLTSEKQVGKDSKPHIGNFSQ
jgi:hypothetical protein